jgi:predicted nucleotidyltransferase component of viral defense system
MIEREIIINLARKFEIDEYSILREYLQLLFLRDFYGFAKSSNVYFKGGTAIHFLLGSFRFSEDLDFTVAISRKDTKQLVRQTIEKSNLEAPGLESKMLADTINSLIYRLSFPTELSIRPLTIRIEFSFRERPLTRKISLIETELPVSPYPMVVHFDFEELLAEKVRAVLTRNQGRDIFDFWFLLSKGVKINARFIKTKLSFYGKEFSNDRLKKAIEGISIQSLKDDLEKFLPKSHRRMISELKTLLLNKIESLASVISTSHV